MMFSNAILAGMAETNPKRHPKYHIDVALLLFFFFVFSTLFCSYICMKQKSGAQVCFEQINQLLMNKSSKQILPPTVCV